MKELCEDKKWQADSDLRCLMESEAIKKDKKRLEAAMRMAKEKKEELDCVEHECSYEERKEDLRKKLKAKY